MKFTKPKAIPVLLCLTMTGLFAATLPYPGFQPSVDPLPTTDLQRNSDG